MTVRTVVPILFVLATATAPIAADGKKHEPHDTAKLPSFEKLKSLVGEWEGKEGKDGEKFTMTYKLTSGGSALVETMGPGTEHEMVTVIHPDGDGLILTHYCMLGNQPQMKAAGKLDGDKLAFKFLRITNAKSDKDMYMHDVTFTFVDKDTVKTEWTNYHDGKEKGHVTFELKRKK